MRVWDVFTKSYLSEFKQHSGVISSIRFSSDCRVFLSSGDKSASVNVLNDKFLFVSSVKLKGHLRWVNDILPLPSSNQCVTCSDDTNTMVWDCETGVCVRALSAHRNSAITLAACANGQCFASGSYDQSVVIWSSETFDILHRIEFPNMINTLTFAENGHLFIGVYYQGAISCNILTGEVGEITIAAGGAITSLSIG